MTSKMKTESRRVRSHFGNGRNASSFDISAFARNVSILAAPDDEDKPPDPKSGLQPRAEEARKILIEALEDRETAGRPRLQRRLAERKAILGLGIMAASQEDPLQQARALDCGLLHLILREEGEEGARQTLELSLKTDEGKTPKECGPEGEPQSGAENDTNPEVHLHYAERIRLLALTEIVYSEQYLGTGPEFPGKGTDVRRRLYDILVPICADNAWSPGIRDYAVAWETRLRVKEVPPHDIDLNVYLVSSIKGGVGKTSIALALSHFRAWKHKEKTLIVDLDFSGPTLQYHLDVPESSKGLHPIPNGKPDEGPEWCYPTFLDLVPFMRKLLPEDAKSKARKVILKLSGKRNRNLGVVLLPDSPTITAMLHERVSLDPEDPDELLVPVTAVLEAAVAEGYRNVVFDLSPGFAGVNRTLVRYISTICRHTELVIVSSSRTSDLASSMYEGVYTAAGGEFLGHRPIRYVVNMWRRGDLHRQHDSWAKSFFENSLRDQLEGSKSGKAVETAEHVFLWRIWSYIYHRSVQRSNTLLTIEQLPFEKSLSGMLSPPRKPGGRWSVDVAKLISEENPWAKNLFSAMGWTGKRAKR